MSSGGPPSAPRGVAGTPAAGSGAGAPRVSAPPVASVQRPGGPGVPAPGRPIPGAVVGQRPLQPPGGPAVGAARPPPALTAARPQGGPQTRVGAPPALQQGVCLASPGRPTLAASAVRPDVAVPMQMRAAAAAATGQPPARPVTPPAGSVQLSASAVSLGVRPTGVVPMQARMLPGQSPLAGRPVAPRLIGPAPGSAGVRPAGALPTRAAGPISGQQHQPPQQGIPQPHSVVASSTGARPSMQTPAAAVPQQAIRPQHTARPATLTPRPATAAVPQPGSRPAAAETGAPAPATQVPVSAAGRPAVRPPGAPAMPGPAPATAVPVGRPTPSALPTAASRPLATPLAVGSARPPSSPALAGLQRPASVAQPSAASRMQAGGLATVGRPQLSPSVSSTRPAGIVAPMAAGQGAAAAAAARVTMTTMQSAFVRPAAVPAQPQVARPVPAAPTRPGMPSAALAAQASALHLQRPVGAPATSAVPAAMTRSSVAAPLTGQPSAKFAQPSPAQRPHPTMAAAATAAGAATVASPASAVSPAARAAATTVQGVRPATPTVGGRTVAPPTRPATTAARMAAPGGQIPATAAGRGAAAQVPGQVPTMRTPARLGAIPATTTTTTTSATGLSATLGAARPASATPAPARAPQLTSPADVRPQTIPELRAPVAATTGPRPARAVPTPASSTAVDRPASASAPGSVTVAGTSVLGPPQVSLSSSASAPTLVRPQRALGPLRSMSSSAVSGSSSVTPAATQSLAAESIAKPATAAAPTPGAAGAPPAPEVKQLPSAVGEAGPPLTTAGPAAAVPVQAAGEGDSAAAPTAVRRPQAVSHVDISEAAERIKNKMFVDAPALPGRRTPARQTTDSKVIDLMSNLFEVQLPRGSVFHYDVEVRAQGSTQEAPVPEALKARCASTIINRHVVKALGRVYAADFDNCIPVFDGRKNIYTRRRLNFAEKVFVVEIEEGDLQRQFNVRLRYVSTISFDEVHAMYEGSTKPSLFQDVVQAADVILRTGPTLAFVPVGRSFFSTPKREDGDCRLGGGRELWFGFYTSIRLGVWKPLVNIDMSATAFYISGPLIQHVKETLNIDSGRQSLLQRPLSESDRLELVKELRTLKVTTTHLDNRRQYRIENLTRNGPNEEYFEWEGRRITVAQYFAEKYQTKLQFPALPCVIVGKKGTMLPMECCRLVPGQHCRRKLTEKQTANVIKKTAVPPQLRFDRLREAVRNLKGSAASYCQEFEMGIAESPVKVEARVLAAPAIRFAKDRKAIPIGGVWRLEGSFLKPAEMTTWAIAVLGDIKEEQAKMIVQQFQREGGKLGMPISPPALVQVFGSRVTAQKVLSDIKAKVPQVQMTVIVLGRSSDYGLIKATAETSDLCMRTQCVRDENVMKKFNAMFAQNLLQKINTKLGGWNNGIMNRTDIMNKPFMAIGIDVNHPGPGDTGTPSIAAIVASMDHIPSQYYAVCSAQRNRDGNRVEWVVGLKQMFLECLQAFHGRNKLLPQRLIVYRDGVSEAQFDAVRCFELAEMRAACAEFNADYKPTMLFIVVQKRHHVRFKPANARDGVGKAGNIPPGSVVDTKIVHPGIFDFYLCSHHGLQGTSRPAHYHVVHDDANHPPEEIYRFSYALCHTYARCTRAVSLPAPAYYAHLVAFRAKEHIKGVMFGSSGSESGSSSTSSDTDHNLEKFNEATRVTKAMRGMMYFV